MTLRSLQFAVLLAFLATTAGIERLEAASFDCRQARYPDEIAICNNPGLSELDTEMGALWFSYRSFPFMMGASGARQDEARQFLSDRRQCGANVACLRDIYRDRIDELKDGIQWATKNYAR
ncbi:hypothetical protein [Bradyrhizobium sp. LHD-71]|uniref:lysozyme inhibitor LprI family protein n=1 Tax=Bradyrhizobium sp. LHD-71 TaxID=3072141 RepID=UPI00280C610E|nr:hypothetical protein [Bradyrhizobium sp. LHD-71]MDQ8730553.1 hypothetical protein [Bradyrhizobium sp. LHD-71]